jgi:hypothetical protein
LAKTAGCGETRMTTSATLEDLRALAEALLAHTLPKAEWTHEAHLGATLYLLSARPDLDLDVELPQIIRSYNEAVGVQNTAASGYHETLTRFYLRLLRRALADAPADEPVERTFARLLATPAADRAFPLRYFTKDHLFSPLARRSLVQPDLNALDF